MVSIVTPLHHLSSPKAPVRPTINGVVRLAGDNGTISWDPITPENARGFLTSVTLAYEEVPRTGNDQCPPLDSAKTKTFTENLYEISSYSIANLTANQEYCVALQASTIAGSSGYTEPLRLSCELKSVSTHCLTLLPFLLQYYGALASKSDSLYQKSQNVMITL